jgi:thioredoxin-related protein
MNKRILITILAFCFILVLTGFVLAPNDPKLAANSPNIADNSQASKGSSGYSGESSGELLADMKLRPAAIYDVRDFSGIGLRSYSLAAAQEESKTKNKYMLMYFWATWCGNCSMFETKVLPHPDIVRTLNDSFAFVSIDFDQAKDLTRQFKIRAVPTFIFVDPGGNPATVLPGAVPPDLFLLVLNYVKTGNYKTMEFDEYVDSL